MSGEIPPELGNLASLEWLFLKVEPVERGDTAGVGQPRQPGTVCELNDNQLSGEIPPELGNLASLEWLVLRYGTS